MHTPSSSALSQSSPSSSIRARPVLRPLPSRSLPIRPRERPRKSLVQWASSQPAQHAPDFHDPGHSTGSTRTSPPHRGAAGLLASRPLDCHSCLPPPARASNRSSGPPRDVRTPLTPPARVHGGATRMHTVLAGNVAGSHQSSFSNTPQLPQAAYEALPFRGHSIFLHRLPWRKPPPLTVAQ